jgi:uncharacterized protein YkwD
MLPLSEPGLAFRVPTRRRALAVLFRAVAVTALLGSMGACGGSGGSSPQPPPPSPPPPASTPAATAPIPAQLNVPTPVGYDADRLAAFNRLNQIRLSAGLGMLAQNVLLDQAAQAHADWIIANDSFTHEEVAGTPGFTGAHWWDRAEALGYVPLGGEEVMSGPVRGADGVDSLINTVYHRAGMLAFEPVDVGIGWSGLAARAVSMPLVIDMTKPGLDTTRGLGQAAQASIEGVSIWPPDSAVRVPLRLGLEFPNPVPTQDVLRLGTPASVTVDAEKTITTTTFVLTNRTTGVVVPTQTLTSLDDPNFLVPQSFVASIPLAVLEPSTTYQVEFSGFAVMFGTGVRETFSRKWVFTTGPR